MPLPIIIIITDIIEYIIVFILYVNWRILKKQKKKNIEESFSFPVLFFPFLIFSFLFPISRNEFSFLKK